jgi:hypothetical protein
MVVKPGTRLASQVCAAELIVVRAPAGEVELTCGGRLMVAIADRPESKLEPLRGEGTAPALGKRFVSDDDALEVLVVKQGTGSLAAAGAPLIVKQAKPLPSSD